jgi:hypothetical protein
VVCDSFRHELAIRCDVFGCITIRFARCNSAALGVDAVDQNLDICCYHNIVIVRSLQVFKAFHASHHFIMKARQHPLLHVDMLHPDVILDTAQGR